MTDYSKTTNFASKDALASGNANKIVKGTEIDDEFTAIQTAIATKANSISPTLTGTPLSPTAAPGTNTTQIATTAFVTAADVASASIITAAYEAADDVLSDRLTTAEGEIDTLQTESLDYEGRVSVLEGFFTGNSLLGNNGYYILPDGLTVQWGRITGIGTFTTATVTFNITFPNAVYAVFCSEYDGEEYNNSTGAGLYVKNNSWTTSGCVLVNDAGDRAGAFWLAIGK